MELVAHQTVDLKLKGLKEEVDYKDTLVCVSINVQFVLKPQIIIIDTLEKNTNHLLMNMVVVFNMVFLIKEQN